MSRERLRSRKSWLDDDQLSNQDHQFLKLVTEGEINAIRQFLEQYGDAINVDCCDCRGYRALDIAVVLHNEELIDELMSLCNFSTTHIQGALVRAVDENDIQLVMALVDKYKLFEKKEDTDGTIPKSVQLTPLMAAAINENFVITRYLLHKGFTIVKPHLPKCSCKECTSNRSKYFETLGESLARINVYRSLASPVYMILTSPDPVLTAFELSYETCELAVEFPEHQDVYFQLSSQCSRFAADILEQCRNTEEVELLLVQKRGLKDLRPHRYSRLLLAIQYRQKKFIAHPSCQQVLHATWVDGIKWAQLTTTQRTIHVIKQVFLTPILSILHVLVPRSKVIKPLRVPLNRFICSVTSYIVFLSFLLMSLSFDYREDIREPAAWPRLAADVWVVGYILEIIINIWSTGLGNYLRIWWNRYDLIMHASFMLSESICTMVYAYSYLHSNEIIWNRMQLFWYHPLLIAEGIFACASVLAFCRMLMWYQVHAKLGPLGTSLTYMVNDVLRFFTVFFVLMSSFAIGLSSLYKHYTDSVIWDENGNSRSQPDAFTNLRNAFKTLFWATFGMGEPDYADIIVSNSTIDGNYTTFKIIKHYFTEDVGYTLWGFYHLLTVVILLNMLIAMMAESYERVQGNADMEWKFARCTLWMSYFDSENIVPAPFNLLPSLRRLALLVRWTVHKLTRKTISHISIRRDSDANCSACCNCEVDESGKNKNSEEKYEKLVIQLRRRYLEWLKQQRMMVLSTGFKNSYIEISERLKADVMKELRKNSQCYSSRRKKEQCEELFDTLNR